MKVSEVSQHLLAQGCNPSTFSVGSKGAASDAYCLTRCGDSWAVYYTERGVDEAPDYIGPSEEDACAVLVGKVMALEHWHLVGMFESEQDALTLSRAVQAHGARPVRNDIPNFSRMGDRRYRVFVKGKDVLAVHHLIRSPTRPPL